MLGAGAAVVALTRPAYVVLIAGCLIPLCLSATWRSRLVWGAAYLGVALALLGGWAVLNDVRYGDLTISRLSVATKTQAIVPGAGPATTTLTGIVQRDVLSLPAYRRLHVSLATYFDNPPEYEWVRLLGIADRAEGLGSDFDLLRRTSAEAAASSLPPLPVTRDTNIGRVATCPRLNGSLWFFASKPANRDQTHLKPAVWPVPSPVTYQGGNARPNPRALPPSREAITFGFLPCASNEIARCVLADPSTAYSDPAKARRYAEVTRQVSRWDEKLGTGHSNRWFMIQLHRLARATSRRRGSGSRSGSSLSRGADRMVSARWWRWSDSQGSSCSLTHGRSAGCLRSAIPYSPRPCLPESARRQASVGRSPRRPRLASPVWLRAPSN